MSASRVSTERTGCTQKSQRSSSLPPSSEFTFLLIPAGCQPASPNKPCTRTNVFTPDSLGQVLPSKRFCQQASKCWCPSELMYYCILMKFIKMVISLCAVVHPICRRHAAAHISLCVRSSHTSLMNYLLKSVLSFHLVGFCISACLQPCTHFIKKKKTWKKQEMQHEFLVSLKKTHILRKHHIFVSLNV